MTKFLCKKCGAPMTVRGVYELNHSILLQCEKCYDCIFDSSELIDDENKYIKFTDNCSIEYAD